MNAPFELPAGCEYVARRSCEHRLDPRAGEIIASGDDYDRVLHAAQGRAMAFSIGTRLRSDVTILSPQRFDAYQRAGIIDADGYFTDGHTTSDVIR